MAVVSSSNADYLSQTAGPDTLPDNSGDWTIFLWVLNIAPAVVSGYKVPLVLFSTDGDYTQPFVALLINQAGGQQVFSVQGYDSGAVTTDAVAVGLAVWQPWAITYDATAKAITSLGYLIAPDTGGFSTAGTWTQDLGSVTWTSMLALNDNAGTTNQPGLATTMFRLWNAKLTLGQLNAEIQAFGAPVAVDTTDLETDTPLVLADDLTDLTSNHNSWTAVGSLTTHLPGPHTGAVALAICPEGGNVYYTDNKANVIAIEVETAPHIVTVCPMRNGHFWSVDNSGTTFSVLREIHPTDGTVIRTVTCDVLLEASEGSHSVMELPNGNLLAATRS